MTDTPTDSPTDDASPTAASELDLLSEFLDTQREVLLRKAAGLSHEDLARTLPPSTLSLARLVSHAALNEDWWFSVRFAGREPNPPWSDADWDADPDWEMSYGLTLDPEQLRDLYVAAAERSRAVVAAAADPAALSVQTLKDGSRFPLRWVLLHMIEETARHAGHADLIRESIDGEVGE